MNASLKLCHKYFVFFTVTLVVHKIKLKQHFSSLFRYRLVPYGNHSYLESLSDKSKVMHAVFSSPVLPSLFKRSSRLQSCVFSACLSRNSLCTAPAAWGSSGTINSTMPWWPSWTVCSSSKRRWKKETLASASHTGQITCRPARCVHSSSCSLTRAPQQPF